MWFIKMNILWAHRPLLTKDLESTVKDGKDGLKEANDGESKDKKSMIMLLCFFALAPEMFNI